MSNVTSYFVQKIQYEHAGSQEFIRLSFRECPRTERIENFLHDNPRRLQIQGVGVRQLDHVGNDLLPLSRI